MQPVERAIVWIGGALFAGSLVLCTVWYLAVFDRDGAQHGWQPIFYDVGLFTVFAAHHSVFARERAKRMIGAVVPQRLLRSCYVWTASILLVMVCLWWQPVGGELYHAYGLRAVLHAGVQLAGIGLMAWSVKKIDPLELAGIRPPPHAARATARQVAGAGADLRASGGAGGELHVDGPYRFVRHPLYLGWILAVFGTSRMTGDRMVFALMTSAYLLLAIPWEERGLGCDFGEAYARYRQTVRWRVIPFIY
jgi:hypothetical protein